MVLELADIDEKLRTTIIDILFEKPYIENGGELNAQQQLMVQQIYEAYCSNEYDLKKFQKMLEFMEEHTKENRLWQERYASLLIHKICGDYFRMDNLSISRPDVEYIKEQLEKLDEKGINILELFFKYKNERKDWQYYDSEKIKFFLSISKGKKCILKAGELDKYIELVKKGKIEVFFNILDHCEIEIEDKSKIYFFQIGICLYADEEDMVRYYRKGFFPKAMMRELAIKLRKGKKAEKIPLLIQWMYEDELKEV